MKRIILLFAAAFALCSCFNEDGLVVRMPSSLARQWISTQYNEETGADEVLLWDFKSNDGKVTFVTFHDLETLELFPQYLSYKDNLIPYVCRVKGNIYTVTLDDGYDSKYYFADITDKSVVVTSEYGDQWLLSPCPKAVTPRPQDY